MSQIKLLDDMDHIQARDENGRLTYIDIPKDTILTVLRAEGGLAPEYICSVTVNGKNYTNVLIDEDDIKGNPRLGMAPIAEFLPEPQSGGRRKRRGTSRAKHKKAKKTRRSRKH